MGAEINKSFFEKMRGILDKSLDFPLVKILNQGTY